MSTGKLQHARAGIYSKTLLESNGRMRTFKDICGCRVGSERDVEGGGD
jgi:hypothetical protein